MHSVKFEVKLLIYVTLLVQIVANISKIRADLYHRLVGEPFILDEEHDGCENNGLLLGLTLNNKGPYGGHLERIWTSGKVLKRRYFHSRINQYSNKTRCASVQLLKDSTVKLILLAGDICENPGPTSVAHQCSVCQKKVAERHRAVSCNTCQLWCHIKCGRISIKEYKQIINTLDLIWSCPACNCMNNIPQQMGCPPCLTRD